MAQKNLRFFTMQESNEGDLGLSPRLGRFFRDNLLEKGMATHSSILACRIPWIEEPSGLQFIGSLITEVTNAFTLSKNLG